MANSEILFITITVRHTMDMLPYPAKGCMPHIPPPSFRAHKLYQDDFSYPIREESMRRFVRLIELGALVQTRTAFYPNRITMFFSVGESFMDGKNVKEIGDENHETESSATTGID